MMILNDWDTNFVKCENPVLYRPLNDSLLSHDCPLERADFIIEYKTQLDEFVRDKKPKHIMDKIKDTWSKNCPEGMNEWLYSSWNWKQTGQTVEIKSKVTKSILYDPSVSYSKLCTILTKKLNSIETLPPTTDFKPPFGARDTTISYIEKICCDKSDHEITRKLYKRIAEQLLSSPSVPKGDYFPEERLQGNYHKVGDSGKAMGLNDSDVLPWNCCIRVEPNQGYKQFIGRPTTKSNNTFGTRFVCQHCKDNWESLLSLSSGLEDEIKLWACTIGRYYFDCLFFI